MPCDIANYYSTDRHSWEGDNENAPTFNNENAPTFTAGQSYGNLGIGTDEFFRCLLNSTAACPACIFCCAYNYVHATADRCAGTRGSSVAAYLHSCKSSHTAFRATIVSGRLLYSLMSHLALSPPATPGVVDASARCVAASPATIVISDSGLQSPHLRHCHNQASLPLFHPPSPPLCGAHQPDGWEGEYFALDYTLTGCCTAVLRLTARVLNRCTLDCIHPAGPDACDAPVESLPVAFAEFCGLSESNAGCANYMLARTEHSVCLQVLRQSIWKGVCEQSTLYMYADASAAASSRASGAAARQSLGATVTWPNASALVTCKSTGDDLLGNEWYFDDWLLRKASMSMTVHSATCVAIYAGHVTCIVSAILPSAGCNAVTAMCTAITGSCCTARQVTASVIGYIGTIACTHSSVVARGDATARATAASSSSLAPCAVAPIAARIAMPRITILGTGSPCTDAVVCTAATLSALATVLAIAPAAVHVRALSCLSSLVGNDAINSAAVRTAGVVDSCLTVMPPASHTHNGSFEHTASSTRCKAAGVPDCAALLPDITCIGNRADVISAASAIGNDSSFAVVPAVVSPPYALPHHCCEWSTEFACDATVFGYIGTIAHSVIAVHVGAPAHSSHAAHAAVSAGFTLHVAASIRLCCSCNQDSTVDMLHQHAADGSALRAPLARGSSNMWYMAGHLTCSSVRPLCVAARVTAMSALQTTCELVADITHKTGSTHRACNIIDWEGELSYSVDVAEIKPLPGAMLLALSLLLTLLMVLLMSCSSHQSSHSASPSSPSLHRLLRYTVLLLLVSGASATGTVDAVQAALQPLCITFGLTAVAAAVTSMMATASLVASSNSLDDGPHQEGGSSSSPQASSGARSNQEGGSPPSIERIALPPGLGISAATARRVTVRRTSIRSVADLHSMVSRPMLGSDISMPSPDHRRELHAQRAEMRLRGNDDALSLPVQLGRNRQTARSIAYAERRCRQVRIASAVPTARWFAFFRAAHLCFELRRRVLHRRAVLLRCSLLLCPAASRFLVVLRAGRRLEALRLLSCTPRPMPYDVGPCDAAGTRFSFRDAYGVVSYAHPAAQLPDTRVPAYTPDGLATSPLSPPRDSSIVLCPEANGVWCYYDTADGSSSWYAPPGSGELRPRTLLAAELPSGPPPRLLPETQLNALRYTGWTSLFCDANHTVLLMHLSTGAVREAPWMALRTPAGAVYFANLVSRETRWLPPVNWMQEWVSRRPIAELSTTDCHPCEHLRDDQAFDPRTLPSMWARKRVEGGAPYLHEDGQPQYPPDRFDTPLTYPLDGFVQVTEQRYDPYAGVLQGSSAYWASADVPLQPTPPGILRSVATPERCGYLAGSYSPQTRPAVGSDGELSDLGSNSSEVPPSEITLYVDAISGSTVSAVAVSTMPRALPASSAQSHGSALSGMPSFRQSSPVSLEALEALAPSVVEAGIVTPTRMSEFLRDVVSCRYPADHMLDWLRAQLHSRVQARAAGIILRSWRFYVSESPYSDEYETMDYLLDEDIAVSAPPYRFLLRNMIHSEDGLT
jgi:hypothetical protein